MFLLLFFILKDEKQEGEFPPEYFKYKLRGVTIHMGTADSGHYYSLIHDKTKDQTNP